MNQSTRHVAPWRYAVRAIAIIAAIGALLIIGVLLTGCSAVVPSPVHKPSASAAADPAPKSTPAPVLGSIGNPAPAGSTLDGTATSGAPFTISIVAYDLHADEAVAAANMFNEAAPAGSHYVSVTIKLSNTSSTTGDVDPGVFGLGLNLVDQTHALYRPTISVFLDDPITSAPSAGPGTSTQGSILFVVPDSATSIMLDAANHYIVIG